jgi:RNA polymerase sigma-70 factor (ECF subfamily)
MQKQQEFEQVALVHAAALLRTAVRLAGSREAAEDLVQEALLRAWRSFEQFERGTNAKAWLFKIMLNLSSRQWSQMRNLPPTDSIDDVRKQPATESQPLAHVHVLAALDELSEEFRVVLVLAVVEGFTCKEIAKMLAIPMGTVMSRLGRARARLREQLQNIDKGLNARAASAASARGDSPAVKKSPADWGAAQSADVRRAPDGGLVQ